VPEGVCVLDFGIAYCLDQARLTGTGGFLGTVHYMAPEQCRGEPATCATDFYALGATLVELLTGEALFDRDTEAAVLLAHQRSPLPDLFARRAELPGIVVRYLATMLEKNPRRRPASARDVAQALGELALWSDGPASAATPTLAGGRLLREAVTVTRPAVLERVWDATERLHEEQAELARVQVALVEELVALETRQLEREARRTEFARRIADGDDVGASALADTPEECRTEVRDQRRARELEARLDAMVEGHRVRQAAWHAEMDALQTELLAPMA
jgi:hypothetical protein